MKNNDTRAMQNPNGEDCTYNRPCSPHGSECASCEYAKSVTHNIAMSAERAHELAHDAEHLRKLMVLWPQSHIIHQLAAALRQAMESSKPADYVAFEIIKEAWRLMDGQDPKTADWHFAASAYINAYHDTAPAQHVIPDEITPDEDNSYDYVEGWNACRSEMLKAQQNEPQNIPENIPAKPIGEHKWISVDERMPDNYAPVLVCSNRGIIWCAEVEDGDFYPDEFPNLPREGFEITHWMPLPAAPAQENE